MAAAAKTHLTVGGRELAFSNLDKVLFPRDGYTKGDLIAYYRAVAPAIVPYLRDTPLSLERFPDGIDAGGWWEKDAPKFTPPWVHTVSLPAVSRSGKPVRFVVCDDEATLAWLANLAAITLHIWYSRVATIDVPDFVLFDLDPTDGCTVATLARVALAFRDELAAIGLQPLVKTTGGTGLHVLVPLEPHYSYDVAKGVAELVARHVHGVLPDHTTLERALAKRPDARVYLDWVQVGRGKTYVAPYTVRARDGAPVSMPLAWSDVEAMRRKRAAETLGTMGRWTIRTVPKLLAAGGDPWRGEGWRPQTLEAALERARSLWG